MTKILKKLRHCFFCGAECGCYDDYHPLDTCGKPECDQAARDEAERERALRCSCQIADHISDECARLGKCKERGTGSRFELELSTCSSPIPF